MMEPCSAVAGQGSLGTGPSAVGDYRDSSTVVADYVSAWNAQIASSGAASTAFAARAEAKLEQTIRARSRPSSRPTNTRNCLNVFSPPSLRHRPW